MVNKFGFSFSWKRALGISALRSKIAKKTGIPTTKGGVERKIGGFIINGLLSLFKGKKK